MKKGAWRWVDPDCGMCNGRGVYYYDHDRSSICSRCCKHDKGWGKLEMYYGKDNGKWYCRACGKVVEG